MMIHISRGVRKNCWNLYDSYGEICVGCGCCSPRPLERAEARLSFCERRLEELKSFDGWIEGMEELQKSNINSDIKYFKREIRYYKKRVDKLSLLRQMNKR